MGDLQKISLECSQRLTELLEYTLSAEFKDEMVVAREIFILLTGKINDDDFGYEQRMQLFQEYFLFEHRLTEPHQGYTIFELFLERAQQLRSKRDVFAFEQLRSAYRSLFAVERSVGDEVVVRDLFSRSESNVFPLCSFSLGGLPVGQVFEGRLMQFNGYSFFTGAFIFHVPGVTALIERMVKNFLVRPSRGTVVRARSADGSQEVAEVWPDFLRRRYRVLRGLQSRRESIEHASKKRAIDQLTLSRSFSDVYQMVSAPDSVTSIGQTTPTSCFVPEVPVIQRSALLNALAQCEVRSIRYKHIEPLKVYAQALTSEAEGLWLPRTERIEDEEKTLAMPDRESA
jgi:hypothetical protein